MAGEGDRSGISILTLRYGLEDRPGIFATFLFGLQHVLIMFAAMIAPPLVTCQLPRPAARPARRHADQFLKRAERTEPAAKHRTAPQE